MTTESSHADSSPQRKTPDRQAEFQTVPGEAQAETARNLVQSGGQRPRPSGEPDLLTLVDPAMRAEIVEQMQEDQGNQFVQRMVVQREPAPPPGASPVSPPTVSKPTGLIVDDSATDLDPQQMKRSQFLSQLRAQINLTVDQALGSSGAAMIAGPQVRQEVEQQFALYAGMDGAGLERTIKQQMPEAGGATTAAAFIPPICARVRQNIEASLPKADTGTAALEAAQNAASTLGDMASSAVSSVTSIFFKEREGGAANVGQPAMIQSQLGAGSALDGHVQAGMSSAFGADFGPVRVHTDGAAAGMADRMNARAFTIGGDIAFGTGEYQPGTPVGDALIAHELAHVVQQGSGASLNAPMRMGQFGSTETNALEADADQAAVSAVSSLWGGARSLASAIGQNAVPSLRAGLRLQRCSKGGSKAGPAPSASAAPSATPADAGAPVAPPAPALPYPAGTYAWKNATLKGMVDGKESSEDVHKYVAGLAVPQKGEAVYDMEQGRSDYSILRKDLVAAKDPAKDTQAKAIIVPITKMDVALQLMYGDLAVSKDQTTLGAGMGPPIGTQGADFDAALKPPQKGASSDFKDGKGYDTAVRAIVDKRITNAYDSMVKGHGPKEHSDPKQKFDMSTFVDLARVAKAETDAVFGKFKKGPEFKAGVNLKDNWSAEQKALDKMTPDQKKDKARALVSYFIQSDREILELNRQHNANASRTSLSPGETEAEATILNRIRTEYVNSADKVKKLNEIDRGWPAQARPDLGVVYMQLFKEKTDVDNRKKLWSSFQTLIHEYMHTLADKKFGEAARSFPGGDESTEYNTLIEGFDSLLTEVVWARIYPRRASPAMREQIEGKKFAAQPFDEGTVQAVPNRYPSYDQALRASSVVGMEKMMAAYFLGKTELIGH